MTASIVALTVLSISVIPGGAPEQLVEGCAGPE